MTVGTVKTQGTKLYYVERLESDPVLRRLYCPTGATGAGGGTADQIETTCLDTVGDKEFAKGLGNTAPISVPFNFIPSEGANQRQLFALKTSGDTIGWLMAFSDGDAEPVLDTDGAIEPPAGRTSVSFNAYVSEVNIDVATNEIVRGTLTLQRSGSETWHWNGPDLDVDA